VSSSSSSSSSGSSSSSSSSSSSNNNNNNNNNNKFINCNWVDTRWQWLFYMYTKYELVTTKFKSGGLHEKHVVATWNVGNHLSICL
jgi:hypothetical protein